jgi:hypothetical protein
VRIRNYKYLVYAKFTCKPLYLLEKKTVGVLNATFSDQVNHYNFLLTFNSKTAIPIPLAAPDPARPTKWPLPMLLANNEAPTY